MTNHTSPPSSGLDSFYRALRRPGITRPTRGRWFAGVASGLAQRLGVDPLVVRAAFFVLSLAFGVGAAVYLTLWLLLPAQNGTLRIERALRDGDGPSIALLVVAALSVLGGNGPWWPGEAGPRFGALVGLVAVTAWYLTKHKGSVNPPSQDVPAPAAPPRDPRSAQAWGVEEPPMRVEPATPVPDDAPSGSTPER